MSIASFKRASASTRIACAFGGFLALLALVSSSSGTSLLKGGEDLEKQVSAVLANAPLAFEANHGQTDPKVRFLSRAPGYTLFLTDNEAVLKLPSSPTRPASEMRVKGAAGESGRAKASALRMRLVGANPKPKMTGARQRQSRVAYFRGNDRAKWQPQVATYERVECAAVYPGVDLIYYGNPNSLEYDFVVKPGADPHQIRLAYSGQDQLALDSSGDLVLSMGDHTVRQHRPVTYQEIDGERRKVESAYRLEESEGKPELSVELGEYDPALPLVIDPVLGYSTYFGGSAADWGAGVAIDNTGAVYVAGHTYSVDFPLQGPYQGDDDDVDMFVSKFGQNAAGLGLIYSTYLGGSGDDFFHSPALAGRGLAVDNAGNAYVAGYTLSGDFPTLGAYQSNLSGLQDAFVAKIDTTLNGVPSLTYSTYLGGSNNDFAFALAVDAASAVYVTGHTASVNFPTLNAFQGDQASTDVYLTKLDPTLTGNASLLYSTYLGGNSPEFSYGVAVDNAGIACVVGGTNSTDFPLLNAFQTARSGQSDVFVTRLDTNLAGSAALLYSTLLGGNAFEHAYSVVFDSSWNIYLTGYTESTNFPTVGAFQGNSPSTDAFVAKIDPHASGAASLLYSTYLGGSDIDVGYGIVLEEPGRVYITGGTRSSDYPTLLHFQPHSGSPGSLDAMVTKLDTTATGPASLLYSTFLGGTGDEQAEDLTISGSGQVLVAGSTYSTDFPTSPNRFQADQPHLDVFLSRVLPGGNAMGFSGGSFNVPESGSPMSNADMHGALITVNRTGDTSGPVSVAYATEDGTAMAGLDYTATSGRLTLNGGEASKSFLVPVSGDAGLEGNETFTIALSNPMGATLNEPATATVTIEDDVSAPSPVGLKARATSSSSVELSWTDMCSNETDFGLEKSMDGGVTWPEVESVPAAMGTGMSVVKTVMGLTRGTSYSFRVRARASGANSDYSNVVEVERPLPAAPVRFRAKVRSAKLVDLFWESRTGEEATFRIERRMGDGEFVHLINTPAGATSHGDATVGPNATYTYRIRAEVGALVSDWAKPATVSTPRKVGGVFEVKPGALNFGEVRVRKTKQLSLMIRNGSKSEDLRIEVRKPAAPFAVTKGGGVQLLGPGESRKVVVRFRPGKRREYNGNLEIPHSGGAKPASVPLVGVGR